jgi:SAM-dependent methyltransferase
MLIPGKNKVADKWFSSDENFDQLYSSSVRELSRKHWTPLAVALKAANFLAVENNVKVLDIGSGTGKFCLCAAHYKPRAFFTGIEQRKDLVLCARNAKEILEFTNVNFIHGNFTQVDLKHFNHFYFYNAFYENLTGADKIDYSIAYSNELYHYYTRYLRVQLDNMPTGTRFATYHSLEDEIPASYYLAESHIDNMLKFWIKE